MPILSVGIFGWSAETAKLDLHQKRVNPCDASVISKMTTALHKSLPILSLSYGQP